MITFKQYITELFDKPYKWKKTYGHKLSRDSLIAPGHQMDKAGRIEWSFTTDDGREAVIDMNFRGVRGPKGKYIKSVVEFEVGDDMQMTGEGDAPKIMSTVLDAIKDGIKQMQPEIITFTADKTDYFHGKPDTLKTGRAKLYKSMVKRFAKKLGYHEEDSDMGDSIEFTLISKEFRKK